MDDLKGKVALVAGASRAAGRAIAVELGRRGAAVYATGRTTRERRSEMNRPETIEETAQLVTAAGGLGIAVRVDHQELDEVRALVERIDREHGRLDVLVNDIWGGDIYLKFGQKLWEHSIESGLRMLRLGIDTHAITSHFATPLLIRNPGSLVIEMTDGTAEFNTAYRADAGFFYDLVKVSVQRMALAQSQELRPYDGTAVALTPGWIRSESMLEHFGVTEENWRDATANEPHFVMSESPTFVGRAAAALAADRQASRWTGQTLSSGQLAKVYGFTDVDGSRPDYWRYMMDVQSKNKPADPTGYR